MTLVTSVFVVAHMLIHERKVLRDNRNTKKLDPAWLVESPCDSESALASKLTFSSSLVSCLLQGQATVVKELYQQTAPLLTSDQDSSSRLVSLSARPMQTINRGCTPPVARSRVRRPTERRKNCLVSTLNANSSDAALRTHVPPESIQILLHEFLPRLLHWKLSGVEQHRCIWCCVLHAMCLRKRSGEGHLAEKSQRGSRSSLSTAPTSSLAPSRATRSCQMHAAKRQLQDLALSAETVLAPACACTHYVPGVMTPNLIRLGADLQEGFCLNLH